MSCAHPSPSSSDPRPHAWRSDALPAPGLTLHVSTAGDDRWSGQSPQPNAQRTDGPLASIDAARDRIRALRKSHGLPEGGILVAIQPGDYPRTTTLEFTADDSGTVRSPIVYAGASRERGNARIIGGKTVTGWKPVTDRAVLDRLQPGVRGRVVVCDLRANGVTDFGGLSPRGHRPRDNARLPLELFYKNQPLQWARWPNTTPAPNDGFAVSTARGTALTCDNPPFSRWKGPNPDAVAMGYWGSEWSFNTQAITSFDPDGRHIHIESNAGVGDRFFVINILEELDTPGEYLLDRAHGLIYFLPPEPVRDGDTSVTLLAGPLVRLHNAENITFERLGFELTRGRGVQIEGGRCVALAGCVVRGIGTEGVYLDRGADHVILSCDISHTGEAGVYCNVGDRVNLIPANITIHNNHFFNTARVSRVYCGAVGGAYGGYMGVTISNNLIHDMDHTAIFFWGNDIRIERNEIYNVVLQSDDAGAVYTGRDFTFQGNTFVNNYLHHTGSSGRHDVYGTMGLYHDDGAGGTLIEGNIFQHVSKPVFAGGGINTVARNNILVDCSPAYWIDERCISGNNIGADTMVGGFMRERFDAVHADSPQWIKRYPSMAIIARNYRDGKGTPPLNNAFRQNIVWRSPEKWMISPWVAMPDKSILDIGDNLVAVDPRFVNEGWSDFRLRPDSPALAAGFTPIDPKTIGLQHDAYRPAIERVESRLDLTHPFVVTGAGATGRVRLTLRNTGDTAVRGGEFLSAKGVVRVEAAGFMDGRPGGGVQAVGGLAIGAGRMSLQAAPPKIASVEGGGEWTFDVKPGQTVEREFTVTIAPGSTRDFDLLQIDTRGKVARPARLRVPFIYPLGTTLEMVRALSGDAGAPPGLVRLTIKNTGDSTARDTIRVAARPTPWVTLSGAETTIAANPAAHTGTAVEYKLTLTPDVPMGAPLVEMTAEGVATAKTLLSLPITRSIPALPADTAPGALAAILADERPYPVFADWSKQREPGQSPFAELRLGLAGDHLAVFFRVKDTKVVTTDMLWTGSCIEVFGAAAHGQPIGQVFLLPAADGKPATGHFQDGPEARLAPEIKIVSKPIDGGYELAALIPLKLLAVTAGNQFTFEAAVTTASEKGEPGARRGVVFGSTKAYAENGQYGTVIRR
ncbi:MAG: right-handed parallel beta-helix repeat-containing protein [Planctomycetes bacterium]|nr:right-handed parallel beta-helix repeat-containing protein [Planctomycetota bacterium]